MSTTQFLASVVSSLAWPAAVVTTIWILRHPLGDLLGALRSARGLGWQFDFERALSRVRELAPGLPPGDGESNPTLSSADLLRLAEIAPRSVIDDAWGQLERDIARHTGCPDETSLSLEGEDGGVFDEGAMPAYEILRGLHREAILSPGVEVTPAEALEFARLSRQLAASLPSSNAEKMYE